MNNEININEEFGNCIYNIVLEHKLNNNLEIGSWDGEGSTFCFVEAMKQNIGSKFLACVEIDKQKVSILSERYKNIDFLQVIHGSSITYEEMLYNNFEEMWNSPYNKIKKDIYDKQLVKTWFDRDIGVLKNIKLGAIQHLKDYYWDSVLIDGGEFTGYSEFHLLKNKTKFLFLDDVHNAFKCYQIYEELKNNHKEWELIKENEHNRNGYAIFKRK
jgi:hypothetical protein